MKLRAIITLTVLAILLGFFSYWMSQWSYSWFPPQASAEAKLFDDLFSLFVGLGTFIWFGVMIPLFYSLLFHRAGKYDLSDGPAIEGSAKLEVIWTAIPIVLVLSLSLASYHTYNKMAIRGPGEIVHLHVPSLVPAAYAANNTSSNHTQPNHTQPNHTQPQTIIEQTQTDAIGEAPIERINVTAKQWAWVFEYPNQGITSTELHLPVDRRVRMTMRSEDVLHGFYIPAFRLKQDVVPNHAIDLEFKPIRTGKYRLRDSMYSGTYFSTNQADVVVQSLDDYDRWLATAADQPPTPAFNPAIYEYNTKKAPIRGWATVVPAPAPIVNYSPQQEPTSPPA